MKTYERCQQCEVAIINGVRCHETACPLAWQDYPVDCAWCGQEFWAEKPGPSRQCCCKECYEAYHG